MKRFRFALQGVLEWREGQLNQSQARLEHLLAEKAALAARRAALEESSRRSREQLLRAPVIAAEDLAALSGYERAVERRAAELEVELARMEEAIKRQRQLLIEQRRQVRLLERLKERKFAEWRLELDRELEKEAADLHAARRRLHLPSSTGPDERQRYRRSPTS